MISPSEKGIPLARAKPIAAGVPESGAGMHEVRLDAGLLGELLAHPDARGVHLDAREARVGPREVDELEEAESACAGLGHGLHRVDAVLVDHDELAGRDLALVLGADEVERAGLGGEDWVGRRSGRG